MAEDLGAAGRDELHGYALVQGKGTVDYITASGCVVGGRGKLGNGKTCVR
ncbi:MAG: hypothetical protein LPH21_04395 [Shewanella sp.]|nr:hypothetical protein [Shewanella sp.]MCF1429819.1 hypothetical protein [Shewanella sp.]MCF1456817.1 hypothetical protein [Shewanella sp.]